MTIKVKIESLVKSIEAAIDEGYQNKQAIIKDHYSEIAELREMGVSFTKIFCGVDQEKASVSYLSNCYRVVADVHKTVSKIDMAGEIRKIRPADAEDRIISLPVYRENWSKHIAHINPDNATITDLMDLGITPQDVVKAEIKTSFALNQYISKQKAKNKNEPI